MFPSVHFVFHTIRHFRYSREIMIKNPIENVSVTCERPQFLFKCTWSVVRRMSHIYNHSMVFLTEFRCDVYRIYHKFAAYHGLKSRKTCFCFVLFNFTCIFRWLFYSSAIFSISYNNLKITTIDCVCVALDVLLSYLSYFLVFFFSYERSLDNISIVRLFAPLCYFHLPISNFTQSSKTHKKSLRNK